MICQYELIIKIKRMKQEKMELLSSIKQQIVELVEQNSHGLESLFQNSTLTCSNLEQYLQFTVHEFHNKQTKMDSLATHSLKLLEMVMSQLEENTHLEIQLQNITQQHNIKHHLNQQLENKLQQAEKCNKEYKSCFIQYQKQLENKEKETDQLSTIVGQIEGLQQEHIEKADGEVKQLKAKIQELTHEVEKYEDVITEIQALLEHTKLDNCMLKKHVSDLAKDNEELQQQQELFASSLKELQIQNNQIIEQLREFKEQRMTNEEQKSTTSVSEPKQFLIKTISTDQFHPKNNKLLEKSISPRESHRELYKIKSIDRFSSMSSLLQQPDFLKNILPDQSHKDFKQTRSIGINVDFLPLIPEICSPIRSDDSKMLPSVETWSSQIKRPEFLREQTFLNTSRKKSVIQYLKEKIVQNRVYKRKDKRVNRTEFKPHSFKDEILPFYDRAQNYSNGVFEFMYSRIVRNRIKK